MKLVFFFPWQEVSGGPYYLCRLADAVAETGEYEVYYTDYKNGICDYILTNKNVKVLTYKNEGNKFKIFEDEPIILIMPIYWANCIPCLNENSKLVFFNWHNECIPVLKRDWCISNRRLKKFLKVVRDTDSVFFCDKTHWLAQNTEKIIFNERYVPVCIPERKIVCTTKLISHSERNISVFGRLCLDKIYAVLDLVDNIIALRDRVKTNIHIIGDGDCAHLIKSKKYPKHIKLIFHGTLDIDDAINVIRRKSDILFAMGTAALDGATVKMPTVIIPNKIKEFHCDKYSFIFETVGYSLGWYPEQIDELNVPYHSMEEIFKIIYDDGQKYEVGDLCYDYYINNHCKNLNLFQNTIDASVLYAKDLRKFKNPLDIKRFFSLIKKAFDRLHGYTQKEYKLFGLPLLTIAKTNDIHYNVFLLCFPLFRINNIYGIKTLHILILVWIYRAFYKLISKMFLRFSKRKDDEE